MVCRQHLNKTYGADVPLVLMNSFNTDEDTEKILRKYAHMEIKISTFNQSRYARHLQPVQVRPPPSTSPGTPATFSQSRYARHLRPV